MGKEDALATALGRLAAIDAKQKVDEALVHGTLTEEGKEAFFHSTQKEIEEYLQTRCQEASAFAETLTSLLQEYWPKLPAEIKQRINEEIQPLQNAEGESFYAKQKASSSVQAFVGLTDATLDELYRFALSLYKEEDFLGAQAFLEYLTLLQSSSPMLWKALALTYEKLKSRQEAIVCLATASFLEEDSLVTLMRLVELLIEEGMFAEVPPYLETIRSHPDASLQGEWLAYVEQELKQQENLGS